jgi:hypothetical protein
LVGVFLDLLIVYVGCILCRDDNVVSNALDISIEISFPSCILLTSLGKPFTNPDFTLLLLVGIGSITTYQRCHSDGLTCSYPRHPSKRQVMQKSLPWSLSQAEAIRYQSTWLRAGEERLEDHIVVLVAGIDLDEMEGVETL